MDRNQLRFALSFGLTFALAGFVPMTAAAQAKAQPGGFFLGADISALDAPGRRPLPAYQEDGKPSDELTILKRHGWTAFRVRVFAGHGVRQTLPTIRWRTRSPWRRASRLPGRR